VSNNIDQEQSNIGRRFDANNCITQLPTMHLMDGVGAPFQLKYFKSQEFVFEFQQSGHTFVYLLPLENNVVRPLLLCIFLSVRCTYVARPKHQQEVD
jgi:hypothetical protein